MAKKKKKRGKAAYAKGKSVGASAIKTRKATRATYKAKRTKPSAGGR